MNDIILMGLNHKTAPVEVRECIAFSSESTEIALDTLKGIGAIKEIMLFSTCNRVEVLLVSDHKSIGIESVKKIISDTNQVSAEMFENSLYILEADEAVRHIFRVSASLDSMIVGEPQILGQVKEAYHMALQKKATGVILNRLLPRAFSVAKRVRSETSIGDRAVSISYAAIELGRKIFTSLEGKKVLLVGAGEMAEIAVEHLVRHHVGDIYVANRTFERGVELARAFDGSAIRFDEITDYLEHIDVIISSTGAPGFVLHKDQVKKTMRNRRNRPLFFIDIAVPRDIDPDINQLPNVYLYDIDDLKGIIEENLEDRKKEALKAERIVDEAVINFKRWYHSLDVMPTLVSLRKKIDAIAQKEIDKTLQKLKHLNPKDYESIHIMMNAITNKFLHDPTLFLKNDGPEEDRVLVIDTIQKLFKLDA